MWCSNAVNCKPLFLRAASRTPSSPIDALLIRLSVRDTGAFRCFPWLHPFPPQSPQGQALCSMASQVLRTYPTYQRPEQQGYGFWPFLLRPVLAHWAPLRSPSFCAKDFPTGMGSPAARDQSMTGVYRHAPYCLLLRITASASRIPDYATRWLAHRFPLSTLRPAPHGATCMTRGLVDSPSLTSIELSSTNLLQRALPVRPSHLPALQRQYMVCALKFDLT